MQRWREAAASFFEAANDTTVEWLCDYGESIRRVIGWMAVLIFIVGPFLLSAIGGFAWRKDLLDNYRALTSPVQRFIYRYHLYLQYSLGAFSTANYSGLEPANDAVKYASNFFTLTGIFLAGLLGFVAGNRIRRL